MVSVAVSLPLLSPDSYFIRCPVLTVAASGVLTAVDNGQHKGDFNGRQKRVDPQASECGRGGGMRAQVVARVPGVVGKLGRGQAQPRWVVRETEGSWRLPPNTPVLPQKAWTWRRHCPQASRRPSSTSHTTPTHRWCACCGGLRPAVPTSPRPTALAGASTARSCWSSSSRPGPASMN